MSARLLATSGFRRALAFERIDDYAKTLRIYWALLTSPKFTDRLFEFDKGCTPFPQHDERIPNRCSQVNKLTQKIRSVHKLLRASAVPTPSPTTRSPDPQHTPRSQPIPKTGHDHNAYLLRL